MKKYLKAVFISLLVMLITGENAFASGTWRLSASEAAGWRENLVKSIESLATAYGDQADAKHNLEQAKKYKQLYPILEEAFEEEERECRNIIIEKRVPRATQDVIWKRFHAVRKTYLGR